MRTLILLKCMIFFTMCSLNPKSGVTAVCFALPSPCQSVYHTKFRRPLRGSVMTGLGLVNTGSKESNSVCPESESNKGWHKTEHLSTVSSTNLGVEYLPSANFSQMSQYQRRQPTKHQSRTPYLVVFQSQQDYSRLKPYSDYKYNLVHTTSAATTFVESVTDPRRPPRRQRTTGGNKSCHRILVRKIFGINVNEFVTVGKDSA